MIQNSHLDTRITTPTKTNSNILSTSTTQEKQHHTFLTKNISQCYTTLTDQKINKKYQFLSSRTSLSNSSSMLFHDSNSIDNNPQRISRKLFSQENDTHHLIARKQINIDQIINYTTKIASTFYSLQYSHHKKTISKQNHVKLQQFNKNFLMNIFTILKSLKFKSKELTKHLNTIYHLTPKIRILPYNEIQKQIQLQWNQNILLSSIRSQWYHAIQQLISLFKKQIQFIFSQIICQQFCQFMAHLTYFIFKQYFKLSIEKKGKKQQDIKHQLSSKTMRYLITHTTPWKKNIFLILEQAIKSTQQNINHQSTPTFRLKLLKNIIEQQVKLPQMQKLLLNLFDQDQKLFTETSIAINRFNRQHHIFTKVKNIINIRVALEQDILTYQKQLINLSQIQDFIIFDKDLLLTCLILSILSNNLKPETILMSVKEIQLILGEQKDKILEFFQCPSYLTDLIVSATYIQSQYNNNPS